MKTAKDLYKPFKDVPEGDVFHFDHSNSKTVPEISPGLYMRLLYVSDVNAASMDDGDTVRFDEDHEVLHLPSARIEI